MHCQIYIKNKWILNDLMAILFSGRMKEIVLTV